MPSRFKGYIYSIYVNKYHIELSHVVQGTPDSIIDNLMSFQTGVASSSTLAFSAGAASMAVQIDGKHFKDSQGRYSFRGSR